MPSGLLFLQHFRFSELLNALVLPLTLLKALDVSLLIELACFQFVTFSLIFVNLGRPAKYNPDLAPNLLTSLQLVEHLLFVALSVSNLSLSNLELDSTAP